MVFSEVRSQALLDYLHHHFYRLLVLMWGGHQPCRFAVRSRVARRWRGRIAATLAGHPAGELSAGKTRAGNVSIRPGSRGRAGAGPDARRMADRDLLLAM